MIMKLFSNWEYIFLLTRMTYAVVLNVQDDVRYRVIYKGGL